MEDNLLPPFIMRESGSTVNDTPKIHCTDPPSNDHCITFADRDLKIPLHINGKSYFFHTRRRTADALQSFENIFITTKRQHWNPYCTSYDINEISLLNYEGETTQENCQEHYLVDHEIDDVNIAPIIATAYDQNFDNSIDNAYCDHVYNTPSKPDIEFASALNQRAEISKMMGSIGNVTENDTPCELFSDPIMSNWRNYKVTFVIYWVLKLYPTSRITSALFSQLLEKG